MILPDVNVVVFAFRREADRHDEYATWLADLVAGSEEMAIVEPVLLGVVRIVTNPRILPDPAPTSAALDFVDALRAARRGRAVSATPAAWSAFRALAGADTHIRGNLVPDAWLAALALAHGARIATADRGFARFPGVVSFDPVR